MSIIKNRKKDRPFVILDRACIQDERLSWRARGLLHYLLSLPANWEINVRDLINRAPDGRDAIYSIIKELKIAGYIIHERYKSSEGKLIGAEYHVIEVPEDFIDDASELTLDRQCEIEDKNIYNNHSIVLMAKTEPDKPQEEKSDTYIINNIHNKNNKEEAAAAAPVSDPLLIKQASRDIKSKIKVKVSEEDKFITDKLTVYQQKQVDRLAQELIHYIPYFNAGEIKEFAKQISDNLISQQNFILCGRRFHRKLSAIRKTILVGGWTPSIESVEKAQALANNKNVI